MTMPDYLRICRRRLRWIVASLVVALAASVAVLLVLPPVYSSSATAFVSAAGGSELSDLEQADAVAAQRAATYADLAGTPVVLDDVVEALGLTSSGAELSGDVEAAVVPSTPMVEITASADSAAAARDLAQQTVESLRAWVESQDGSSGDDEAAGTVSVEVVAPAEEPEGPVSPRPTEILGLGALAGLVLGLTLAFLRESLDTTLRSRRDVERVAAVTLLGVTTRGPGPRGSRSSSSSRAEHREICSRLRLRQPPGSPSSFMVLEATADAGDSPTALLLARAFRDEGTSTLLVRGGRGPAPAASVGDAGSRRRSAAPEPARSGAPRGDLMRALAGRDDLAAAVATEQSTGLDVLDAPAASVAPAAPAARAASSAAESRVESGCLEHVEDALESFAEGYDVTIIDGSALARTSDAALLARLTSGAVVLARHGRTTREELEDCLDLLDQAQARVVGLILVEAPSPRRAGRTSARGAGS